MTEIEVEPFDWNDNFSKIALEDFSNIQKDLPYCTCQTIGMALAKLELLEKQGCKVEEKRDDMTDIEILKDKMLPCLQNTEWEKAIRSAIKALETCEDCISRDMALEKMADFVASGYADSAEDFEEYSNIICELPGVQPKAKTGRWECNELFYEGESRGAIIRCSKCGNEFKVSPKVFESLYDNERFCNHCGAKMEE